ncbi:MAG: sugar transferase [Kiritimatiellae bacterium]|nr:sugar transferase [Kiritimatiellia bacterium]
MTIWLCNPFDNLPEEGGRRQRYAMIGRELVAHGYNVVWWTSDFRHATKAPRPLPSTFVNVDGVRMFLLPTIPYRQAVSLRRFRSHRAFARTWRNTAVREVKVNRLAYPDLIVASLPPLSSASAARFFRSRFQCAFVIDIQDLWPDLFYQVLPSWARPFHLLFPLEREARMACRHADGILAVGHSYTNWAKERGCRGSVLTAYLGIDLPPERPAPGAAPSDTNPSLVYLGNLGRSYDLETVIHAAIQTGWTLDIAGSGSEEERLQKLAAGSENIRFHGFLQERDVAELLARSTVGVIPMFDRSGVAVPNKIADYAATGLPIVNSLSGETRELLDRYQAGCWYQVGDTDSLIKAVQSLPQNASRNSRRMAEEEFDSARIYPKVVAFLESFQHRENRLPLTAPLSKRIFDCALALLTSPLWFPLFLLVAFLTLLIQGRPVFFRQSRPGFNSVPFQLRKFRTMKIGTESDAERLTKFGQFLRATSLDELPELFSVLAGKMSLVGPRPLLTQYLERYTPEQARRHDALPGITGWAQVHGRNEVEWEKKFEYDVWYVRNRSFWLDIKILGMTLWQVLSRKGITMKGEATASEFLGTASKRKEDK